MSFANDDRIINRLMSDDGKKASKAIIELNGFNDDHKQKIVTELVNIINSTDDSKVPQAFNALSLLGVDALPALKKLSENDRLQEPAIEALIKIGDEAIPTIAEIFPSLGVGLRYEIIRMLILKTGSAAVPLIKNASSDRAFRQEVINRLTMPNPNNSNEGDQIVDAHYDILKNSTLDVKNIWSSMLNNGIAGCSEVEAVLPDLWPSIWKILVAELFVDGEPYHFDFDSDLIGYAILSIGGRALPELNAAYSNVSLWRPKNKVEMGKLGLLFRVAVSNLPAALEDCQIRGRVSSRLSNDDRISMGTGEIFSVLQRREVPSVAWIPDALSGPLRNCNRTRRLWRQKRPSMRQWLNRDPQVGLQSTISMTDDLEQGAFWAGRRTDLKKEKRSKKERRIRKGESLSSSQGALALPLIRRKKQTTKTEIMV